MSDLTPETLAELRRRAEACPMPDNDPDTLSEWYEIEDLTERNYPIPPIDAAFIAAASPDVVLGLLGRLEHMREARDNARAEVERLAEAVRALHQPVGRHNFCGTCAYAPWPCPTYRALEREADR